VSATAVYLQNRSPRRVLGKKTPAEAFTGRRSNVDHIRVFGCVIAQFVDGREVKG
jgi:hypothetical protein